MCQACSCEANLVYPVVYVYSLRFALPFRERCHPCNETPLSIYTIDNEEWPSPGTTSVHLKIQQQADSVEMDLLKCSSRAAERASSRAAAAANTTETPSRRCARPVRRVAHSAREARPPL